MTHIEKGLKLINNDLKHILEFGVYKGNSIHKIRNLTDLSFKVFGFDSFEGLPENWISSNNQIAGNGVCKKGFFSTNGEIPNIKNIKFFKGLFEETIPEYLKESKPIAFLHIDCDLYSSTKTVLYKLNNIIVKDTIIVFDEWVYNPQRYKDHEQKCFYEWVKDNNRQFELIRHNYNINEQQIVKIIK